jgi:hypothetical protein
VWPVARGGVPYDAEVPLRKSPAKARENLGDHYFLAAALIVTSIIAYAAVGRFQFGQVLVVLVQCATLIVILDASQVSGRLRAISVGLMIVAAMVAGIAVMSDNQSAGPGIVTALLALVGPPVIVIRLRTHRRVDLATVAGSLCIYLLSGMFFAALFGVIGLFQPPFFVQNPPPNPVNYLYFSFTTLTTLGYGDLTARLSLGRMLSITEALFGQLYLVSVVAVLVSNLGRERRSAGEIEELMSEGEDES